MPWAIATARDALSNNPCESAAHFKRPAKLQLHGNVGIVDIVRYCRVK